MKKAGIVFIIAVSLTLITFIQKEHNIPLSDLVFSNVEALAAGEGDGGGGGNTDCAGSGSLYCNGGYYKYRFS